MPLVHAPADQHRAAGEQNQRLAQIDAAQKQPGDKNRHIGERGSQIGLHQHQEHGNAHKDKGLEDVPPGERASAQIGKVARHRQNQNQLDPLGRLKMHGADTDPAPCAQHLVSHQFDRDQRQQEDAVRPGNPVQQAVIIDLGEEEHGHQTAGDPEQLLGVEAGIFGVQRGRVDFKYRDRAERSTMPSSAQSKSRKVRKRRIRCGSPVSCPSVLQGGFFLRKQLERLR